MKIETIVPCLRYRLILGSEEKTLSFGAISRTKVYAWFGNTPSHFSHIPCQVSFTLERDVEKSYRFALAEGIEFRPKGWEYAILKCATASAPCALCGAPLDGDPDSEDALGLCSSCYEEDMATGKVGT